MFVVTAKAAWSFCWCPPGEPQVEVMSQEFTRYISATRRASGLAFGGGGDEEVP